MGFFMAFLKANYLTHLKLRTPSVLQPNFLTSQSVHFERSYKALKWKGMKSLNSWHRPTVEKAELTREGGAVTKCQHYLVLSGAWNERLRKLSGSKNNLGHGMFAFNFLEDRTYRRGGGGGEPPQPYLHLVLCCAFLLMEHFVEMSTADTQGTGECSTFLTRDKLQSS